MVQSFHKISILISGRGDRETLANVALACDLALQESAALAWDEVIL